MPLESQKITVAPRAITHRTKGQSHGPVTRLISPSDLGQQLKPFVFLDRIDFHAGGEALFDFHPHSGIATVTTVFEGDTLYEDSTGAKGTLVAGGVEWMRAGGGVWHTASPANHGRVRGYQLWLALPESLETAEPQSEYLAPEALPQIGPVEVVLGSYQGVTSPLPQIAPLTYLHVALRAGEAWTYVPDAAYNLAFVAVGAGDLQAGDEVLSDELAIFAEGSAVIAFHANTDVEFMIGSAARHPYDLVLGNYSVHTSREALRIAASCIQTVGRRMRAEGKI